MVWSTFITYSLLRNKPPIKSIYNACAYTKGIMVI